MEDIFVGQIMCLEVSDTFHLMQELSSFLYCPKLQTATHAFGVSMFTNNAAQDLETCDANKPNQATVQ